MLGPPLDAAAIHAWFSNLAGAEHIATQHAISGLMRWLHRVRPSRVLEIGPGIGTLSYTVLRWAEGAGVPIELTCVEQDAFCRSALIENRKWPVNPMAGGVPPSGSSVARPRPSRCQAAEFAAARFRSASQFAGVSSAARLTGVVDTRRSTSRMYSNGFAPASLQLPTMV